MQQSRRRKPRFQRSQRNGPLRITPRDLDILTLIAEHRFLQSHQLVELVSGSEQHLIRRLARLFHAGYVLRPPLQRYAVKLPRNTLVYSLSRKGLTEIAEHGFPVPSAIPRIRARAVAHSLTHDLFVSEVMVKIRAEAKENGDVFEWLHQWEDQNTFQFMKWGCRITHEGRSKYSTVIPDASFMLISKDGISSVFFLEYDRGTMPIHRKNLEQSSIFRKILCYKETRKSGILCDKFEIKGFRVLVVTESEIREQNILKEIAKIYPSGKSTMFLSLPGENMNQIFTE